MVQRWLLAGALVFAAVGCNDQSCPASQQREWVYNAEGRETNSFVCIDSPDTDRPPPQPMPSSKTPIPPKPDPPTAPAPPSSACASLDAGDLDVFFAHKASIPSPSPAPAPADGRYRLIQASIESGDAGPSPLVSLRAMLSVTGAKIDFGGEASKGSTVDSNESFTMTVAPGTLTKVCDTRSGAIAAALFPTAPGSSLPGSFEWSAARKTLTLVLTAGERRVELIFAPES